MNHIDEHTLELYALKAAEVAGRSADIERHLTECDGCRALVEEMRGFYSDLGEEMKARPERELSDEKSLVRRRAHLKPVYEPFAPPMRYIPSTPLAKMFYFVRRHPVVIMTMGFAVVAAFGWLLNDTIHNLRSDEKIIEHNPLYTNYDIGANMIRVYNQGNQELWSMPSPYLRLADSMEYAHAIKYTRTADLNRDGKNEIVTSLNLEKEEATDQISLKVLDSQGGLLWELGFAKWFHYKNREYDPRFITGPFVIGNFSGNSKNEIACIATNSRSPSYIARIDGQKNVLGEYWHFGHLQWINMLDLNKDGKDELIIQGLNDLGDTTNKVFPIIIILDPAKLNGVRSASIVDGYGFTHSNGEIYYIGIPTTDMNDVLRHPLNLQRLEQAGDDSILFAVSNNVTEGPDQIWFQYRFSFDMKIIDVKSGDQTDKLHDRLVADGKLDGKIDQTYLNNLKNSVRYWDGNEWRNEWTKVQLRAKH